MKRFILASVFLLLSMNAAAAIRGVAMTSDGQPIPNARVSAYAREGTDAQIRRYQSEKPERVPVAESQTTKDGTFAIDVKKTPVVSIQIEAPGFAPSGLAAAPDDDLGAILLMRAETRQGKVTGGSGPLAGARVVLSGDGAEMIAVTAEDGTYSVPDPARWATQLTATAPDLATESISRFTGKLPIDIRLTAGVRLAGRVFAADGRTPVAGATLLVDGWPLATSAEDGAFAIAHAPRRWKELRAVHAKGTAAATPPMRGQFVLRLGPFASVSGIVREAKTNRPLGGATIFLGGLVSTDGRVAVSDDRGRYSFPACMPSAYVANVSVPGFMMARVNISISSGESVVRDIAMERSATISGTVVDENGRGLPAVGVMTSVPGQMMMSGMRAAAFTSPTGTFVLRDVPSGGELMVRARPRGLPATDSALMKLASGDVKSGVTITIPLGIEVEGTVVDSQNNPLRGVSVIAGKADTQDQPWQWQQEIQQWLREGSKRDDAPLTDSKGIFRIRLPEGQQNLAFYLRGYVAKLMPGVKIQPGIEPIRITLADAVSIAGRLLRNGSGIENAFVYASEAEMPAYTLADGSFVLEGLTAGDVVVSVSKSEEGLSIRKTLKAPANDIVIDVPAGMTIHGRVVTADGGAPVTSFRAGATPAISGAFVFRSSAGLQSFSSDDGAFVLNNVQLGTVDVIVEAPGFARKRVAGIIVTEGKEVEPLEIALQRGVRLSGTVTGPDGSGLSGVWVRQEKNAAVEQRESSPDNTTQTDAEGKYSFEQLEAAERIVSFRKEGYTEERRTVKVEGREVKLDIRMSKGMSVSGVVTNSSGAPVADARVSSSSGARQYNGTSTDASGQFTLEGLAPARYTITARKSGFVDEVKRDVDVATVTAPLHLTLGDGGSVHGTISGISDADVPTSSVWAEAEGSYATGAIQPGGRYRIEGVKPGTVRVSAEVSRRGPGGRIVGPKVVEVKAGEDVEANFDLEEGSTIRGRVTQDGTSVAEGVVGFEPTDPMIESYAEAPISAEGTYEANGLKDGVYRVRVSQTFGRKQYLTRYTVKGSSTFDIDIRSTPLTGRVIDLDSGEPVEGAVVTVAMPEKTEWGADQRAVTNAHGEFRFESLAEGAYRAQAQKDGYGYSSKEVTVGSGGADEVVFKLAKSDGLVVRAFDARDGRAVVPEVLARDSAGTIVFQRMSWSMTSPESVRLPLGPGRYRLTISVPGYAARTVDATAPGPELRVGFTPGGTLIVRSDAGHDRNGRIVDGSGQLVYLSAYWRDARTVISQGTTTFQRVEPGSYVLQILDETGAVKDSKPFVIREGETTELSI